MAKTILFDEFHLTLVVPRGLRPEVSRAIRRTLDDARFRAALRRAIRNVFSRYPPLGKVRFTLTW